MKTLNILEVRKENNTAVIKVDNDFGVVEMKRVFREHIKEIREEQKKGNYCFEIQGVLYW